MWPVGETWIMTAPGDRPDHVVDATTTLLRKIAMLRGSASSTAQVDDPEIGRAPGPVPGEALRPARVHVGSGSPVQADQMSGGR